MEFCGFELHPEFPADGLPLSRFGPPEKREARQRSMAEFAGRFGVEMGYPDRAPNTRKALAVAEYARDHGKLRELWDAAMDAHWLHGRDLTDDGVLRALAEAVGLDPVEAVAAASDAAVLLRLDSLRDRAAEAGVSAIPAFLIGDQRIVGCQPYEQIARAAENAGARRRD